MTDQDAQLARAVLSLDALACGDAFGEVFLPPRFDDRECRTLSPPPWRYTDDTLMAASIVRGLMRHGHVDQDWLAADFASLFDPARGYGPSMYSLLPQLGATPAEWPIHSRALFGGQGSFGNGAAMRVAPLGAFYADDLAQAVEQAARSAVVTHAHAEAVAGAIAIAVAAAIAWQTHDEPTAALFLQRVHAHTPESRVRTGIERAMALPLDTPALRAAYVLGNGARTSAEDTVPFVLWSAAACFDDFEEALWRTAGALGDRDTNCAMVAGILVLRLGAAAIPPTWKTYRESWHHLLQLP